MLLNQISSSELALSIPLSSISWTYSNAIVPPFLEDLEGLIATATGWFDLYRMYKIVSKFFTFS